MSDDIWLKMFDTLEGMTTERRLCIMRDAALALVDANRAGSFDRIEAAQYNVERIAHDTDLFLSGVAIGRKKG